MLIFTEKKVNLAERDVIFRGFRPSSRVCEMRDKGGGEGVQNSEFQHMT